MITRVTLGILVSTLIIAGGSSVALGQTIWHVPTDPGAATIQQGLDSAVAGDIVEIACGTYNEFDIQMKSGVTLRSETGLPDCVTIDAQSIDTILDVQLCDAGTLVEGVTFTGGYGDLDAGAVLVSNSTIEFRLCNFRDNFAVELGGAFLITHGLVTIDRCHFIANNAGQWGGAFYIISSASFVSLEGCLLVGNSADEGGAIRIQNVGNATLDRCTLVGNTDGIDCQHGATIDVVRSIIANSTEGPGAACSNNGVINLSCTDIHGNFGGDWIGCVAPQLEENGNFLADPCFCGGIVPLYTLCDESPCALGNHPWGCNASVIGAADVGCTDCLCEGPVATRRSTWGGVKTLYR